MLEYQTTADVLMIRPAGFYSNEQTAPSNRFQNTVSSIQDGLAQQLANTEFNDLVTALRGAGVRVRVFDDTREFHTPDSVFPNNWVSFHADGTVVLYPMLAKNRRLERRADILESLSNQLNFHIQRTIDLTHHEARDAFLEGTGSLVLDRVNRVAYACISSRTHLEVLVDFAQQLHYELITFYAVDRCGTPIYHTNVLLSIGRCFAVICADAINADERVMVLARLRSSGHDLIELSFDQLEAFTGNLLELNTSNETPIVALSQRAAEALSAQQRSRIEQLAGPLVTASIPTIETLGGGSVRCMLAEIHLPRKDLR